jgi:hypothetical protein
LTTLVATVAFVVVVVALFAKMMNSNQSPSTEENKLYPVELSTDEEEMEGTSSSCLPSVEEARSSMINPMDETILPKKRPWRCYAIWGSIVVVVAIIIGLSVSLASNKNRGNTDTSDEASSATSERFDATVDYLAVRRISPAHTFRNTESPQFRAAQWIANEDALRLDIPNNEEEDDYRFVFRYVMAVLFYYWGGLSEWEDPLGFLGSQDVCQWRVPYTIFPNTPEQQDLFKGVGCLEDGTPTMLDIGKSRVVQDIRSFLPHSHSLILSWLCVFRIQSTRGKRISRRIGALDVTGGD